MLFAILRHAKVTSQQQLTSLAGHNSRSAETPNADPDLPRPIPLVGSRDPARDLRDLLKLKGVAPPRKNAVLGIEIVLTASPEFFERGTIAEQTARLRSWADDNLAYLADRYGAGNIANAMIHLDEKTPHIHAVVAPLVYKADGREKGVNAGRQRWRLSAHDVIGGNRERLVEEQSRYADAMAHHGLHRGIASEKRHTTSVEWELAQRQALDDLNVRSGALALREAAIEEKAKQLEHTIEKRVQELSKHATQEIRTKCLRALERLSAWFLAYGDMPVANRTPMPEPEKIEEAVQIARSDQPRMASLVRLANHMGLTRE